MRNIELHKTNIAGVWRLSTTGCRLTPSLDVIQDTGAIRGSWQFLHTVWWGILPSGEIIFAPKMSRCRSLRQICEERKEHPLNGCDLFQKLLDAVDSLRDHLFSLIVELLTPDLIFVSSDSSTDDMHLSLVTLPFPCLALQPASGSFHDLEQQTASDAALLTTSGSALRPVSEIETQSDDDIDELIDDHRFDALPSWFSLIFNWDDETLNANRAAWHSRLLGKNTRQIGSTVNAKSNILTAHRQKEHMAFSDSDQKDLGNRAQDPGFSRSKSFFSVLNRHSQEQKGDLSNRGTNIMTSSHPYLAKTLQKHKEESIVGSFFRRIFGFTDELFEEESTEDLDLSENALRIASLSEGLPGTPEEEHGRHAYILTDVFLIGRDIRKADFALDDPGVSRIHARITRSGGHFFIEDLGSKNGTTIDGIKIKRHTVQLLPEMCRIAFGDAVFYFRSD